MDNERKGFLFALSDVFLAGLFPVITKYGVGFVNPVFFAAISALCGGGFMLIVLKFRGELRKLFSRELALGLFLIGFFGTFCTSLLFFFGSTLTSGVNSSILLQSEPVYSIVLSYFLLGELIRKRQIAVTLLILCGAIIVLYNGVLSINIGDIFVLLTPLFWQIAHVLGRKTLEKTSTYVVTAGRTLYGGLLLFILTLIPGFREFGLLIDPGMVLIFVFQGIVAFACSALVWYEAIARINLSKATAIIAPYPVFSVILAWIFLGETVSIYQMLGLAVIVAGIIFLSRIHSERREKRIPGKEEKVVEPTNSSVE
ncbi:MAG: DMT family transporter [Candidatus Freyarchaeota archaeon]|nr:DMT family transporter [Candidatus Jordarchaeia archaeon]MBS7278788.1 DMT family transporter [Candidatus Jordarchaeia archaeon]